MESLPGCEEQSKQFRDEVRRSVSKSDVVLSPHSPLPLSVQQIDGRAFLLLTQRDIVRIMSIKLGPALKIYNSILMFKHAKGRSQSPAQARGHLHDQDKSQSDGEDREQLHAGDTPT